MINENDNQALRMTCTANIVATLQVGHSQLGTDIYCFSQNRLART